ncbi:hypothetical protein AKJ09_09298 [Labilithrix luteola]|uniref:Uncharacterized protein n=1 Tax=Labilithrix luteola TaxID=1391654 RepID=A0A0K1QB47_9BACT|nr:hypothetical protein AKJ09_09298 [Labilithrix luteola]
MFNGSLGPTIMNDAPRTLSRCRLVLRKALLEHAASESERLQHG